jgi:hypothetical protein
MSGHPGSTRRDISHNSFNDHTRINLGDVYNHVHYSSPHAMPHAGVIHVIPCPRNEDLVLRLDLIERLDELLPSTLESYSAALWEPTEDAIPTKNVVSSGSMLIAKPPFQPTTRPSDRNSGLMTS